VAIAKCAAKNWVSDNASTTGASLAFFCAFSIAPMLVIVLTTVGWIVGAAAAFSQIGAQLNALFGASTAGIILDAIKSSQQTHGIVATTVSMVTLLIGATTVLSALETLLEQVWNSQALAPVGVRGWLRTRFLSLGFILTLGFLLLVSLTVSTGLSTLQRNFGAQHPAAVGILGAVDLLLSIFFVAFLFAVIFRYLPARRLPWKTVAAGGDTDRCLVRRGPLGGQLVLGAFDAAERFRGSGLICNPAVVVILHVPHLSVWSGIHCVSRWTAQSTGGSRRARPKPAKARW
jgi:membrane protein